MINRGGSRTGATFKMERFVIIVNGWKPLTIITKSSILDVTAFLDPPLVRKIMINNKLFQCSNNHCKRSKNTFANNHLKVLFARGE